MIASQKAITTSYVATQLDSFAVSISELNRFVMMSYRSGYGCYAILELPLMNLGVECKQILESGKVVVWFLKTILQQMPSFDLVKCSPPIFEGLCITLVEDQRFCRCVAPTASNGSPVRKPCMRKPTNRRQAEFTSRRIDQWIPITEYQCEQFDVE